MTRRSLPATPTPPTRRSSRTRWEACCAGDEPAEKLSPRDREDLIYDLWALGWSDRQVAEHTQLTTHAAARIRQRLGLDANTEGAA